MTGDKRTGTATHYTLEIERMGKDGKITPQVQDLGYFIPLEKMIK